MRAKKNGVRDPPQKRQKFNQNQKKDKNYFFSPNPIQPNSSQFNPIQPNATQFNPIQPNSTQVNPIQPNSTKFNHIQPNFISNKIRVDH